MLAMLLLQLLISLHYRVEQVEYLLALGKKDAECEAKVTILKGLLPR